MTLSARLDESVNAIRKRIAAKPRVGVVLGSGLGAFGDTLQGLVRIPYGQIPHIAPSTVKGHNGTFCFGQVQGVAVACMQGRIHLYEGHPVETVVHGVRTLARLGVTCVLLTNAAGGLVPSWAPGDLMLISDHLNLTGQSPLFGPNDENLGPRFLDMTEAYDAGLRRACFEVAEQAHVPSREGVYAGLLGPSYETPAEIRMLRTLGAQAVGMSTVLETLALRHMGVKVGALSCITNLAAGLSGEKLDHKEVEATANRRKGDLIKVLSGWIARATAEA